MAETFTLDQVRDLLNTVMSGIRADDNGDDRVFTLAEVAARTGWALDSLERDCRERRIEHTRRGRRIGMTSRQIALEVHRNAVSAASSESASGGGAAVVRATTLRSGAARPSRRTAA